MNGRVLLLANPRHPDDAALHAAVELARWQRRALHALLLRDTAALRGAALERWMEVRRHGGQQRPLREKSLQTLLLAETDHYRQLLQRQAEAAGLSVTIAVQDWPAAHRLSLAASLSRGFDPGDMVVSGPGLGVSIQRRGHAGLAALLRDCAVDRLLWASTRHLPRGADGRIVALIKAPASCHDPTSADLRRSAACLRVAQELAQRHQRPITVLLLDQPAAAGAEQSANVATEPLSAWIGTQLDPESTGLRLRTLPALGSAALAACVRIERGIELVVDRTLLLEHPALITASGVRLELPVTVVDCAA